MVLWIGVDDTDSLQGMCTTFLATEIVRELTEDFDLIGYPRLVRLNPTIPWKTRGNAAICLRFGRGVGARSAVGEIDHRPVFSYRRGSGRLDPRAVHGQLEAIMERWCAFDEPTTNPGFVVLRRPPSPGLYWKAVREVVSQTSTRRAIAGLGFVRGYKNGRGIIGAAAATAWRPRDRTYELLAYREREKWGSPRDVDPESVMAMDRAFPSTFNNYDYANSHVALAPRSPCPVLMGIRGDVPLDLPRALRRIDGEAPSRWMIFETNQGTDDHIRRDDWRMRPNTSVSLRGTVLGEPADAAGGHVFFPFGGRRRVAVAAYEPSKQFRSVIRKLAPGDTVRVMGSIRRDPRSLNLEKLQVLQVVPKATKVANPRCPVCNKSMKSIGRDEGFRCLRGHVKKPTTAAVFAIVERQLRQQWYEPPVSARRHIAKPLKRLRDRNG
jgi:tRNA(Ile2)-agmatinylcytidine synthase